MKIVVALIGKAGAGKDTIAKRLCQLHPNYNMIISCTTRPMREGEEDGINYYYLSNEEFITHIINGDMLEVTEFNNWQYGTLKSTLKDGINIGIFNPEGFCNLLSEKDLKVIGFLIDCEDKIRLLRQLNREESPDVKEIIRRFSADEKDFSDPYFLNAGGYSVILNNTQQDIVCCVETIQRHIEILYRYLGQKGLNI